MESAVAFDIIDSVDDDGATTIAEVIQFNRLKWP